MTPASLTELITWATDRFGPVTAIADHSWPHDEARVVSFAVPGSGRIVVKSFRQPVHFERECAGYRYASPILGNSVPRMLAVDEGRHMIALTHLPGALAEVGHDHDPATHHRAAQLLRQFHDGAPPSIDSALGARMRSSFERYAARCNGLVTAAELAAVRDLLVQIEGAPIFVVACHGDFSPRNWLVDGEVVRLIDFARFQRDHWTSDLLLLSRRYWIDHPSLRDAFFAGYGRTIDEADLPIVRAARGRWAIGTIVWSREHADAPFEQLGRDALADLLG